MMGEQAQADGVEESLTGAATMVMTAAARAGQELARAREERHRVEAVRSEQTAREYARRVAAEQQAARAYFAAVNRPEFIGQATGEQLAGAYWQAHAWAQADEVAAAAQRELAKGYHERFGQDLQDQQQAAEEHHDRATQDQQQEQDRQHAQDHQQQADQREQQLDERRQESGRDGRDLGAGHGLDDDEAERQARLLLAGLDADSQHDHAGWDTVGRYVGYDSREEAAVLWDSAERRAALAEQLAATVDNPRAVQARVSAEVAQGRPPQDAVAPDAGRAGGQGRTQPQQVRVREVGVER